MAKKFKGTNAQLVGDTRLTHREMKKFSAAYFNVQRDNELALAKLAATGKSNEILAPAPLGEING